MSMPGLFACRLTRAFLSLALGGMVFVGCKKSQVADKIPTLARSEISDQTRLFQAVPVGAAVEGQPWVAHVATCDLDRDGLLDVVVCEARLNTVSWLRQQAPGQFEERVLAAEMRAPVHAEVADMDGDGDWDIVVSSMSVVFPNNDRIGALFILENDGKQQFVSHTILDRVARVTDAKAADFNGDGKVDLAVGQFGYDQGEVRWLERVGDWSFRSHPLLDLAGAINVVCADFTGDRRTDIAVQISQEWEEIYLFENDGQGGFRRQVIWGSTNQDYASSGMTLGDLNRDGRPDLIFANGDGFGPAAVVPGPRPWHGVQWLENVGHGSFRFHRIGDLAGAYSPVCVDLDRDGAMDVVAVSAFNEWEKPGAVSLMWFRNRGDQSFSPEVLAYSPTHLLTAAAGDFDGTGKPSLVTGAMHAYPPHHRLSRVLLWQRAHAP